MRTEGIGTLLEIARRSRWIVLVLVIVGAVQMNIIRHAQGAQYSAHARVILSPTDLASALSGISAYVDPSTIDQTEQALADSPQLYTYAAQRDHKAAGSAAELAAASSASKSGSTITFTAVTPRSATAIAMVNAVARAYPTWRAQVSNSAIELGIKQLNSQLKLQSPRDPDLVAQLNRLRILKTLTSGNVLLVEQAHTATKIRPQPVRDSLLGGFIGLFVALLVIGARESLDSKVRSEDEIEEVLEVPVLGTIEALPRKHSAVISGRDADRYGDMYALLAAGIAQQREGEAATIIVVTSATAQEGKTTTAVNLAAALARRNARVKLVDLDARRPSIGRALRIPQGTPGGEQVLLQNARVEPLLWDVSMNGSGPKVRPAREAAVQIAAKGTAQLQVLPIRPSTIHSVAGHRARLTELIAEAAADADFVVIDTPPALSTPDVTELAKLVDMVLLVVRHGRVSRRNLLALHRLHRTWPHVGVQAVMVGVPADGNTYSYYAGE